MSDRYEAQHCPGTILWVVVDTHHANAYVKVDDSIHFLPAMAYDIADSLNDAEDDEP